MIANDPSQEIHGVLQECADIMDGIHVEWALEKERLNRFMYDDYL